MARFPNLPMRLTTRIRQQGKPGHIDKVQGREMEESDEQFARINAIIGDDPDQGFDVAVKLYFEYLQRSLKLPVEVTGIEDFRWEEYYVVGPGSRSKHDELRKKQPSYMDRFQLLQIDLEGDPEWMMFAGEDIAAHVRRRTDRKEFILGLSELETTDEDNPNHQLLDDYSVFFVNFR